MRAASGRKIALLLAKIHGDTDDTHRKPLYEILRSEFGNAVEISLCPVSLPDNDGDEYDSKHGTYVTVQKWLDDNHCDFLVAGHEKGKNASGETILSLQFVVADIGNRE